MTEVLGVVSAAAQLGTLCCSLVKILKTIKSAPLTLRNYTSQLQDISNLSSSISQNPLLQTLEIEALTQSLLSLIRQAKLNSVLKKNRIIQSLYFLFKQQDLLEILCAVERQKLSLSLSIEQIQSAALYNIRADIKIMAVESQKLVRKRITSNAMNEEKTSMVPADITAITVEANRKPGSTTATSPGDNGKPKAHSARPRKGRRECVIRRVRCNGGNLDLGLRVTGDPSCLIGAVDNSSICDVKYRGTGDVDIGSKFLVDGKIPSGLNYADLQPLITDLDFESDETAAGEDVDEADEETTQTESEESSESDESDAEECDKAMVLMKEKSIPAEDCPHGCTPPKATSSKGKRRVGTTIDQVYRCGC